MTCNRSEQVHAYHDRQLGPAAREEFAAHLAECPACAQRLAEVQAVSRLVAGAPLPEAPAASVEHYYKAWDVAAAELSTSRGVLRVSGWMTAAAAAILVGSLLLIPPKGDPAPPTVAVATGAIAGEWETAALMPPPVRMTDRPDQFVELAQWMAEDLSDGGFGQR